MLRAKETLYLAGKVALSSLCVVLANRANRNNRQGFSGLPGVDDPSLGKLVISRSEVGHSGQSLIRKWSRSLMLFRIIPTKICCVAFLLFAGGCYLEPDVEVRTEQVKVGEVDRTYRLVIPNDLAENAPVVIAWHGFGDSAESMAHYSQLDRLAERYHFLLVYPEVEKFGWRFPRTDMLNPNGDADVAFFDAIRNDLPRYASINMDRIYVVGMSEGATFTQWLTIERARDIAAVVAHSGGPPKVVDKSKFERPILLIVGTEDLGHDTMREAATQYHAAGVDVEFRSVPGLGHAWSTRNNEAIWTFLSKYQLPRSTESE